MSSVESTTSSLGREPEVIGEFPCTQTQLRCWVLDQLTPGNPSLNVAVRWEIKGNFKASTLEAAFRKIIQRHEILRTRFIERDGRPFQQVVDAVDFKMSVIDLRNVPADQRQARVMQIGEETAREPFDLSRAGLIRVTLLMTANDSGFLLITVHQTCFDGYSIRVLGREVGEIASAIDAGRQPTLPELPLQYGDYALWQEEWLSSYGFEAEKTYWRERLDGVPYFEVETDHPRAAVKSVKGSILGETMPLEFGERMEHAAREAKVSSFAFGAAVISVLLYRYANSTTPVLVGTNIAGRDQSDIENMLGVFINNLVLRFDLTPETTFAEHLKAASRTVEEALNNQNMPFNKLVEALNPVRDPSRNPVISCSFNMSKAFMEDQDYGGFKLLSAPSQSPGVIYEIGFGMVGRPSGWRMSVEYNSDLFEESTIKALLKLWQQVYDLALNNPNAPISSIVVPPRTNIDAKAVAANAPAAVAPAARSLEAPGASRTDQLAALWAEILDVDHVGPDGNFFQLGGHSLLALRLLSAVRTKFGVKPDLELLFRKPTLKAFAESIFEEAVVAPAPVVQPSAVAAPVVAQANPWELIACKTGTGAFSVYTLNHPFLYYRLANELPDSVSVYNVNMFKALKEQALQKPPLEKFAAQAIEAMNIDPAKGPVAIVGLCVNGVLAVEVTRQLREKGVEVEFTAMVDAWAPGFVRSQPKLRQMFWKMERRVKRLTYFTGRFVTGRLKAADYFKEFNVTLGIMNLFGMKAAVPSDEEAANAEATELLVRAAREYRWRKDQDKSVMMFRSQAHHRRARKLMFGWGDAVAANTRVIDLEGWHEDSLTRDGISKLARFMSEELGAGPV
jgi:thioesterase domain-containing protein/acyl carrier protein